MSTQQQQQPTTPKSILRVVDADVIVPLIDIGTTSRSSRTDNNNNNNNNSITHNNGDTITTGNSSSSSNDLFPSYKTSRALVSALQDSGFALVRSPLLTPQLQSKALQAASRFLTSNQSASTSTLKSSKAKAKPRPSSSTSTSTSIAKEGRPKGMNDDTIIPPPDVHYSTVDVISHPTDPKVYAMLNSEDQYVFVSPHDKIIREYVTVLQLIKMDVLRHIAIGLFEPKIDVNTNNTNNDNTNNNSDNGNNCNNCCESDNYNHNSNSNSNNNVNVNVNFFAKRHDENNDTLRLITYFPTYSQNTGNRCKEHSDYGTITLLSTDGISGLEFYHEGQGTWLPVPYVEGALVLNVGSLLAGWTNGALRATLHRVAGPASLHSSDSQREVLLKAVNHARTSIAFFADPNNGVSEALTATATVTTAATTEQKNDDLTDALGGMSVKEYITFRSGGDGSQRTGVSFTAEESEIINSKKK